MQDKEILSEKVSNNIQQMIIDREILRGEKLPNEFELSDQLGVSRSTIREAIKSLVSKNILEVKRGLGTFVVENPGMANDPLGTAFMDESNLLKAFFEVRFMLEPEMAAMAAVRRKDEEVESLNIIFQKLLVQKNAGKDHTKADIEFHNEIAMMTHNPILQRIVPIINDGIIIGYKKTKDNPESGEIVFDAHQKIFTAILNGDAEGAKETMRSHILYGLNQAKNI
jgi:DNA-binding FadR family transcriptional regulator